MAKIKINFKTAFPTQKLVYNDDDTENIMMAGGLGSGKTRVLCEKALKLSLLNKDVAGGFLCQSYKDFWKDVQPEFEKVFGKFKIKHKVKFHGTRLTYHFPWSKAPLYIFSGEKEIAGPNLGYCLINEFSLIPWQRINEMMRRVRVRCPHKQRIFGGTPEDKFVWIDDFIDMMEKKEMKDPGSFVLYHAHTEENTVNDEDYADLLRATMDDNALKVFLQGQTGVRLGGDYFYYKYDDKAHVSELACYDENLLIHVGLDFNVGKMACSYSHKVKTGNITNPYKQHFFDETLLFGESDTYTISIEIIRKYCFDKDLMDQVKNIDHENEQDVWLDTWQNIPLHKRQKGLSNMLISGDASARARKSSGTSDFLILEKMGFITRFRRSNPRLRERQLLIAGLMQHNLILVNPKCKYIRRDFLKVEQDKLSFGKLKDKDDKLTHMSDGCDYVLNEEYELAKRKSKQRQL